MKTQNPVAIFCLGIALVMALITLPCTARPDNPETPHRKADVKIWKTNQANGKDAFAKNDLTEAEKYFKAALAEAEYFDAKDERLADTLKGLGGVYYAEGRKADSEPLYQQAAEVLHGYPQVQVEVAALMEHASVCIELRHYDEAIKSLQRVQSLAAQHFGRSHPMTVESTLMLAEVYFDKGDYAQAEPLLRRSFDLFRNPTSSTVTRQTRDPAAYGRQVTRVRYRPNYAYAFEAASKLDFIFIKQNRTRDSADILKQTFDLVDNFTSSADPAFPEALYELCLAYEVNGNFEVAKSVYEKLLDFAGKSREPAKTAAFNAAMRLQGSLSEAFIKQQKPGEAEFLFTSLSSSADKIFGPNVRESDTALANLGKFYLDQNVFEKAEPLYRRQLEHAEKYQPGGVAVAPVLAGQEIIYSHLGRDSELDEVYRKQIQVYEKVFGQDSTGLVKPLTARAALLRKLKRDSEAGPLEARASAISAAHSK